jgi:superfamily II DNA helicase RecQ
VAEGKYDVVLASPEILLKSTGYFWNYVLRKRSGALYSKIAAVALDECHCIESWGRSGFRVDYFRLSVLREAFPHISFLGLTATMTPTSRSFFFRSTKFKNPVVIKQPIRRKNLSVWMAPMAGTDFEDLQVLFSDNISAASDIPQTIIFYNARVGCGRMAKWLRAQLPPHLQSQSGTIIRSYNGILDEPSRQETLDLLRGGDCRMVVCTDAFGLGMNIKAIPRVVLWKLDSKLGIDGFYQRIGRAGRDSDATALALIFVTKANLSGQYASAIEKTKEKKAEKKGAKNLKKRASSEIELDDVTDKEFDYTIPVCQDTEAIYQKVLSDIYAGPTAKALATNSSESKLVHGLHWTVQTSDCRIQPILVAFDDEEKMKSCAHPTGSCDRCVMKHLIQTNTTESPPILHGVPFTITLAYQEYQKTLPNKVQRKRKAPAHTITPERIAKLVEDIKAWRANVLTGAVKRIAGMKVEIMFPNRNIVAIASKAKNIRSEDDLRVALRETGYSLSSSFISTYIKDLHDCIARSLKESHPPPQLQRELQQTASRSSQTMIPRPSAFVGNRPNLAVRAPVLSRPEEQSTVISTIIPTKSVLTSIPHWPIPQISAQISQVTTERPPLAEKSVSEIGTNIEPEEPVHSSGYNLRRRKQNKRDMNDENVLSVIDARKRRKVKESH